MTPRKQLKRRGIGLEEHSLPADDIREQDATALRPAADAELHERRRCGSSGQG